MKENAKKISLGDIAEAAGVSVSAVSLALLNKPGISKAKRDQIVRIAKKLGYAPNARLSSMMVQVRKATSQDLLPIAWLNTSAEKDAWHCYSFHTPYLTGARARAAELGYKIEEIWTYEPGLTMKRLSKILYQRGIEGVVVPFPARHFRLDWDHLASVNLGSSLLIPRLNRVTADLNYNLQLTLRSLRKLGYRRIGINLWQQVDSSSNNTIRAIGESLYHRSPRNDAIPPLFHASHAPPGEARAKEVIRWLKRYKPDVIVGHNHLIKDWVEAAGYRVPEDVGLVNLAVDDDVLDWAGIHSRRREMGASVIDQLVSQMRNRQYGVPKTPIEIVIRGVWQNGNTLKTLPAARP
jgi:DNA-binding LacI/PurR family transcriptional regulator